MANAKSDYVILDSSTISGCEIVDEVYHHVWQIATLAGLKENKLENINIVGGSNCETVVRIARHDRDLDDRDFRRLCVWRLRGL